MLALLSNPSSPATTLREPLGLRSQKSDLTSATPRLRVVGIRPAQRGWQCGLRNRGRLIWKGSGDPTSSVGVEVALDTREGWW